MIRRPVPPKWKCKLAHWVAPLTDWGLHERKLPGSGGFTAYPIPSVCAHLHGALPQAAHGTGHENTLHRFTIPGYGLHGLHPVVLMLSYFLHIGWLALN